MEDFPICPSLFGGWMPFEKQCMEFSFIMQLRYVLSVGLTCALQSCGLLFIKIWGFLSVWHGHGNSECRESSSI